MILFLLALAAAAWLLQKYMAPRALRNLACSLRAEQVLCEPGEPFTLLYTVENRGRLPVLFLRASCSAPMEAELAEGTGRLTAYARSARYSFTCFLMPRQRLEHRFRLRIGQRGRYAFSDLRLGAGDFLGLDEREEPFAGFCEAVVLPRRPEKPVLPAAAGGLMGERTVRRWIHEDPILSAGFREYTGAESLRSIAWNRSLQSGRLMVRQMDHTAENRVTVLLSLSGGSAEQCEELFRLCRGVCEELEAQHCPYAFLHNGMLFTAVGILMPVETGLGPRHRDRILEGLGRAEARERENLSLTVRRVLADGGRTGSCLLLAPARTPELLRQARLLSDGTGASVTVLCPEVTA